MSNPTPPDSDPPAAPTRRKRGTQLSREALSQALLRSKLKTQAALAARIAELEGLPAPLRDSVGRAFREQPVGPLTTSRIARALDVPEQSLYLHNQPAVDASPAAAESVAEHAPGIATAPEAEPPAQPRRLWQAGAGVLLAVIALWWFGNRPMTTATPDPAGQANVEPTLQPQLDAFTLAIAPLPGDADGALGDALRVAIAPGVRVTPATADLLVGNAPAEQILEELRTDLVLTAARQIDGRFVTYTVDWHAKGNGGRLWLASLPSAAESASLSALGTDIGGAFNALIGESDITPHVLDGPAHKEYLQGRALLFDEADQNFASKALMHFDTAISLDPQHADAHAGRCEALLRGSWQDNEQASVLRAEPACARALTLDPDSTYVATMHGYFLRKSGRVKAAVNYLHDKVEAHKDHPVLRAARGSALFDAYLQGDAAALDSAIADLREALVADPTHWRWHAQLARAAYYAGDLDLAIEHGSSAASHGDNEVTLANLGIAHFCKGDFAATVSTYERLQRVAPDSYLASEYIGLAHYYQGNFDAAAAMRRAAIDSIGESGSPEVHAMWGNLGDALRHIGDSQAAAAAYRRAAAIIERDFLAGNAAFADHAHRAFYYTIIAWITNTPLSSSVRQSIESDLQRIATDLPTSGAAGSLRTALTWQLLGTPEHGASAAAHAAERCAGLVQHPDLDEVGEYSLRRLLQAAAPVR